MTNAYQAPAPPTSHQKRSPLKLIGFIIGGVVLLGLVFGAGHSSGVGTAAPAPAPVTVTAEAPAPVTVTATAEPGVPAAPVTVTVTATPDAPVTSASDPTIVSIQEGTNLVGTDVQPGTYRTTGTTCYWARLSGLSGEFGDVITNGIGPSIVEIAPTDKAFISQRCSPWTQVN